MNKQLALPGIDMRPTCTFCGQPGLLGQYSPLYSYMVCRECSLAEPYPIKVFEVSERSKDRSGLRIIPDAPYELRERRAWLDDVLKQAAKGVLDERQVTKLNLTYRDLRNPIRRSKAQQYNQWHKSAIYAQLVLDILSDGQSRNIIQLSNAILRQEHAVNMTALSETLGVLVEGGQVRRIEGVEVALPTYKRQS